MAEIGCREYQKVKTRQKHHGRKATLISAHQKYQEDTEMKLLFLWHQ